MHLKWLGGYDLHSSDYDEDVKKINWELTWGRNTLREFQSKIKLL